MADFTTALLVDDEPALLEILEASLPAADLKVTTCGSSHEAKKLIDSTPFGALVTDALPGYDGVVTHFRRRNPNSPAILLTGGITPEQEAHIRAAGAQLVLYKPVGMSVLRQHIGEMISLARQTVEGQQPGADADVQKVIALEHRLLNAWVAADVKTLDDLLGEEYVFASNSPSPEKKQQRLHSLASGRLRYVSAVPKLVTAQHYGQLCIVTAVIEVSGERDRRDISGKYRSVRVYSKKGKHWKAVAGQLTPTSAFVA